MNNSSRTSVVQMKRGKDRICVVCEDESDGLHFGQPTCRACAAFFRRTVSQKLQYTCKREGKCEIDKGARNMCRSCRFKKCLRQGMLTSAVQNVQDDGASNKSSGATLPQLTSPTLNSAFEFQPAAGVPLQSLPSFFMANSQPREQVVCTSTSGTHGPAPQYKHLNRMMDGYHQFLSLRKAGYAMVDDMNLQRLTGEEVPRSHYDNYKKICKISTSLKYDMVDRFFWPFSNLPVDDKRVLFHSFMSLFCNAERAFRTSKKFGPGDDRLIMPDGGFVRLSEFHLFFKDSKKVTGDPEQVARIFHNAIQYLITNVVAHMRNIDMQEMELLAMCGMFLWTDSPEVTPQTLQQGLHVRNEIIVDLHKYYQSLGHSEEEITLKTANLFLLIPKLETAVKMMLEDASISDLFNMLRIEESCKGHVVV